MSVPIRRRPPIRRRLRPVRLAAAAALDRADAWLTPRLAGRRWSGWVPGWVVGLTERPMLRPLCAAVGHEVIDDQCGRPAHRYCPWCHTRCSDAPLTDPPPAPPPGGWE